MHEQKFPDEDNADNMNILDTASRGSTYKTFFACMCYCCDENSRRQKEFKKEMKLLSRLRQRRQLRACNRRGK